MAQLRAVFWDVDGTLADTEMDGHRPAFNAAFAELGLPIVWHFFETGLVPKFPSLIVSVGFLILAAISFMCALILDAMLRFQNEARMLAYIQSSRPDVQKVNH